MTYPDGFFVVDDDRYVPILVCYAPNISFNFSLTKWIHV
ncbi:hypothetical protein BH10BAC3_BH10BAC3_22150 [soil metagenome]